MKSKIFRQIFSEFKKFTKVVLVFDFKALNFQEMFLWILKTACINQAFKIDIEKNSEKKSNFVIFYIKIFIH